MRYAVLNLDYKIENIIEADKTFADTIMAILIDDTDVQIGDTYNTTLLWFDSPEGIHRSFNTEILAINENIVASIRTQYSETDELKLLRIAITDPNNADFVAYNTYIEQCRANGNVVKQKLLESYYKHILAVELEAGQ